MIIKFDYNNFLIMDDEKLLSISHHFFPVFTCKNRIMLSVTPSQCSLTHRPYCIASRGFEVFCDKFYQINVTSSKFFTTIP